MALPNTIEICRKHFMDSEEDMLAAGVSQIHIDRVKRLRDAYNVWVSNPNLAKIELVNRLQSAYAVSQSTAYEDLKLVEYMLGNFNESSKKFHRFRFNEGIREAIALARKKKDLKNLIQAYRVYAQFNRLDEEDVQEVIWDERERQPFVITSNPEVLGIKPMPNIDKVVKSMIRQYGSDIEDITYDEVELNTGLEAQNE